MSLTNTRGSRQSRAVAWTASVLAAGVLAGCGTTDAGLQPGAAR